MNVPRLGNIVKPKIEITIRGHQDTTTGMAVGWVLMAGYEMVVHDVLGVIYYPATGQVTENLRLCENGLDRFAMGWTPKQVCWDCGAMGRDEVDLDIGCGTLNTCRRCGHKWIDW